LLKINKGRKKREREKEKKKKRKSEQIVQTGKWKPMESFGKIFPEALKNREQSLF
jgi:hypothetical protein